MANPNQYNDIITDFLRFLIKKGLYVSFLTNWSRFSTTPTPLRPWLISSLEYNKSMNDKHSDFISSMGPWCSTIEGYDFWYDMYNEWERFFIRKYKL